MKTIINELTIKNFKSIKEIKLDCKQVNIFIGKPNTGKSNILEAISLLTGDIGENKKFLEGSIYYENISELFNMQETSNQIIVMSNIGAVQLSYFSSDRMFVYFADNNGIDSLNQTLKFTSSSDAIINFVKEKRSPQEEMQISDDVEKMLEDFHRIHHGRKVEVRGDSYSFCQMDRERVIDNSHLVRLSPIRSYHYKRQSAHGNHEIGYLLPPHGDNLLEVLQHTPKLQEIIVDFFKPFGFDIVLIFDGNKIKIQKKTGAFHVQLSYSLIADTLQRMIFHLAAIYSNKDSVILFEEPEAHTYAPYQSYLAGEIIEDEQNQYFITTHSDLIFDSIVRENPEKVAVFIVGYDGSNTTIRPLTKDEITDQLNNYTSIFQNLDKYDTHES